MENAKVALTPQAGGRTGVDAKGRGVARFVEQRRGARVLGDGRVLGGAWQCRFDVKELCGAQLIAMCYHSGLQARGMPIDPLTSFCAEILRLEARGRAEAATVDGYYVGHAVADLRRLVRLCLVIAAVARAVLVLWDAWVGPRRT